MIYPKPKLKICDSVLTRRLSLTICRELWVWLAQTGVSSKSKWLGWDKYGRMINDCPLCERIGFKGYDSRGRFSMACVDKPWLCPIKWPKGDGTYTRIRSTLPCQSAEFDSPWCKWMYSKTKSERQQASREIIALIDQALTRLDKEGVKTYGKKG